MDSILLEHRDLLKLLAGAGTMLALGPGPAFAENSNPAFR